MAAGLAAPMLGPNPFTSDPFSSDGDIRIALACDPICDNYTTVSHVTHGQRYPSLGRQIVPLCIEVGETSGFPDRIGCSGSLPRSRAHSPWCTGGDSALWRRPPVA